MKNKNEKMVQSTIKKILKLLIDQQISQNNDTKSQPSAFKVRQESKNKKFNN